MTIENKTINNNRVIAVNYPAALLRLCLREGMSSQAILKDTEYTKSSLDSAKGFIAFDQYRQMIVNAYEELKSSSLGLQFGLELSLTTHGMLGVAALASLTYGDAIKLTARFFQCRFPVIECLYNEREDYISLELRETTSVEGVKPFLIESIFASLREVSKLLIDDFSEEIIFEFDFEEPDYKFKYSQILGNNLRFNQSENRMIIPIEIKSAQLKLAEPLTRELAETSCERILNSLPQQSSVSDKIRKLLSCDEDELLNFTFPQMEKIATHLNMSPRTLRRRLKLEGTCLQDLIDELRKELSLRYLKETSLSITQISSQLDFNDASYFSKTFKRWIGITPSQYRENLS